MFPFHFNKSLIEHCGVFGRSSLGHLIALTTYQRPSKDLAKTSQNKLDYKRNGTVVTVFFENSSSNIQNGKLMMLN